MATTRSQKPTSSSPRLLRRGVAAFLLALGSSQLTMVIGGTASLTALAFLRPDPASDPFTQLTQLLRAAAPHVAWAVLAIGAGLWLWDWSRRDQVLGVMLSAFAVLMGGFILLPQGFVLRAGGSVVSKSFLIGYGILTFIYLQTGVTLLASAQWKPPTSKPKPEEPASVL